MRRCRFAIAGFGLLALLGMPGCAVGPDYFPPPAPVPPKYKEISGWKPAKPRDLYDRGDWWRIYRDPMLDRLIRQVEISNQSVAVAEAAFRQSVALVKEARAALFPVIGLTYNPLRSHQGPKATATGVGVTRTIVTLETTGTWDIDVWGKVRRMIESNASNAQGSAGDVANIKLMMQAQLATAYFNLRAADSLKRLLGYSGVAQGGYILTGIVVASQTGVSAIVFYLAGYLVMNFAGFAALGQLGRAHAAEGQRVEDQHDVLLPPERGECDVLVVRVPQGEIGSLLTDLDRHALSFVDERTSTTLDGPLRCASGTGSLTSAA